MPKPKSKESLRNLSQYQGLSDEEFDKVWEEMQTKKSVEYNKGLLENRIRNMMEKFKDDYALDDLKFNDTQVLRALIKAIINLEDYEDILYRLQADGISSENIRLVDKLNGLISKLRKDISNLQEDLKITRKVRKEDREDSVESYIKDLQEKANKYYKRNIFRAVCPKCGMMLFDGWFLYPEENNKIILECGREVESIEEDSTEICDGRLEVTSQELKEMQKEYKDTFPEGL